jgi:hypothetical protein
MFVCSCQIKYIVSVPSRKVYTYVRVTAKDDKLFNLILHMNLALIGRMW